jgi:secretion/DNA translocation related TadE-like protein
MRAGDIVRRRRGLALRRPQHASSVGEGGVATMLAVGWIVVLLTASWIAVLAAAIATAQHHVDGAADLAALSAAQSAQSDGDACNAAARVARGNDVAVQDCRRDGVDVVVTVVDRIDLPLNIDGTITATARAGP